MGLINMLKYYSVKEIFELKEKELKKGLDSYNYIMSMFMKANIDKNLEFQKVYKGFYKVVRRSASFI